MKKLLFSVIAVSLMFQAKAQLFSPESFTGAAIGAIAGGVIGHNSGRHGGEGAAIGAGVGFLAGSIISDNRHRSGHYSSGYYSSPGRGYVSIGYSSPHYYPYRHHHHGYWGPRYSYGPRYSFGYSYYSPVYVPRTYAVPVYTTPVVIQQAPAPTQTPVTIINNNYYNSAPATPMSGANAMFGR